MLCVLSAGGCDDTRAADGSVPFDGSGSLDGAVDAGTLDAALDASRSDGGAGSDANVSSMDAGSGGSDAGGVDAGARDAGAADAGPPDTGPPDTGPPDTGPPDTGPPDAGGGRCISGATGTHAVRFRWSGSGPSSTAYVVYEENQLPDRSRWRVTANSRSIGYTPVFTDTFLGEGGLDLEGTAFIDVELSTVGLSSIRNVTIAIYGRSFNTTASGSFEWQTFDGIGSSAYGLVSNVAPYQWYAADATSEFSAGDAGVLLRISAGPPSDALIVNRVEICFDAS